MSESILAAALGLGFLGSLHCAAMCGPLVVAGTCRDGRPVPRDMAGYVLGRAGAYALGGAAFGVLGHRAHHALGGAQAPLAWVTGALFLLYGLYLLYSLGRPVAPALVQLGGRRDGSLSGTVAAFVGPLLPRRGVGLGLVTGVLPCGMLMGGWMLAATTRSPAHGALAMLAFSLGSLPALALPVVARRALAGVAARLPRASQGVAWCLLGVWIAARPLLMAAHGGH